MSTIEVNKIAPVSGGTTVTMGDSGDTFTVTSGATLNASSSNLANRANAKPLIINGDMQVAQRGTSVSTTAGGYKTVDRLQFNTASTTGDATFSQEDDAPANTGFRKSMKITPNATESMSASKNILFTYAIEGQDVQVLQHGSASPPKATLSFWVKSNKTGAYSMQVKEESITDESYVLFEYTISQANTWEQKVFSWTGNSAHTINNDNAMGFRLCWHLASGSDDHRSASTSWVVDSSFRTTANQVNLFDNTSNNWYLTGVQLEVGEFTSATLPPFQHESFGDSLRRCQRYFQMRAEGNQKIIGIAHWGSGSEVDFIMHIPFMRTRPSLEYTTGNEYWAIGSGGTTNTLDNLNMNSWSTEMNINLWTTTGAGGTTGFAYYGYSNNASAKLAFLAEL